MQKTDIQKQRLIMENKSWCVCTNYNCQYEGGYAEPYSFCPGCGNILEPTKTSIEENVEEDND